MSYPIRGSAQAAARSSARSILASVSSRPRTATDSKIPGETVPPLPAEALLEAPGELLGRELTEVVAVHPAELLLVEDRRRLGDAFEREALDQLLRCEELGALVVAPAEEREVVAHRLREIARVPKVLDGSCAVALGELLAVGTVEQRQVRVDRRVRAEGAQDQDLAGRVRKVVRSAHDVRDPHVAVVYGDREVV